MIRLDGYLKIKTKIDNKDIDKDIAELENKINNLENKNAISSREEKTLQNQINKYEELLSKADEYRNKINQLQTVKNGIVSVSNPSELTNLQIAFSEVNSQITKQASGIDKIYIKLSKVKQKQLENNQKITQFKNKIDAIKANNIKNSVDGIGKSITGQISQIGKMSMAIIGIRTAWGAVRNVVSLVRRYNPQIETDWQYMGYCIANIVAPAVQWLTRLLYTALSYINAIMQAWFGINIFANSSAKAFKKMQKSAGGTAKSSKEIQKSLQGFDEMNVLQDTNSNSSSGGSGVGTPSMDLSNIQGEKPEWLKWIIGNKDLILSVLGAIALIIGTMKLSQIIGSLINVIVPIQTIVSSLGKILLKINAIFSNLGLIRSLGIAVLIGGIIGTIYNLIEYLNDPSWENFGKVIQSIGVALIGLGVLIGGVPVIVAGAIVLIVGTIVKYWEQIKSFFQNGIDWLASKSDWVHEMFGDTIGNIYDMFVNNLQYLLDFFDSIFTMIKGIFDGFIMFIKGVFTGDWKMAWEGIKKIFTSIWEGIKGVFFSVWNSIKSVVATVGKTVGNIIASTFKAVINGVLRAIENILNFPIRSINKLVGVINKVPGINLGYLSTFNLPRLAKGGVISQPTQAIIGEAGKEAVVPLENNMEWLDMLADKLASKIGGNSGYYIINMDGRVIQRGIAKRQQELAFARNGR